MLRFLTSGESHGKCLSVILEGMPAGLGLSKNYIDSQLQRRQVGYGRGKRMEIEKDEVEILSGLRFGKTLGSPIALLIKNRDWENWQDVMRVEECEIVPLKITKPRPGHADLPGLLKYHQEDIRNVLERSSARETAARVAAGAVARKLLAEFGINIISHTIQIGKIKAKIKERNLSEIAQLAEASSLRCADKAAESKMIEEIDKAQETGDSLGGIFEVLASGVPVGLGSYVHWDRRLDSRLSGAIMSIPGIKGVEIGLGFRSAKMPGSKVHDEIFYEPERGFFRKTNRAGGLEGGVTNGEPIVLRAAMKPISTLRKPLKSVDVKTKEPVEAFFERADVCAVPSAAVVGEAVVALEIANAMLEKFGADSLEEMKINFQNYIIYLKNV